MMANKNVRADYLFIDNLRFLAMAAIVMRHCNVFERHQASPSLLESWVTQLRGFGVLLFFVGTAFLMAEWLSRPEASLRGYWRNRVNHVVVPWLIWVGVYVVIDLFKQTVRHHLVLKDWPWEIWVDIFGHAYWFVPLLMFSLAILLPLQRYWNHAWLGCLFLGASLVYGLNQYYSWFSRGHAMTLFAYLFYLWLGLQLHRHYPEVSGWLRRVSWGWVLAFAGLTLAMRVVEDKIWLEPGNPIGFSPLRPSSQAYALAILLVLVKAQFRLVPPFINVRKETFGIYLLHPIVLSVGRGAVDWLAGLPRGGRTLFERLPELVTSPWGRVVIWLAWFLMVYAASLALTKLIRRVSWGALIGARSEASGGLGTIAAPRAALMHLKP